MFGNSGPLQVDDLDLFQNDRYSNRHSENVVTRTRRNVDLIYGLYSNKPESEIDSLIDDINYSSRYICGDMEYRHAILPKKLYDLVPKEFKNRLLADGEWRHLGMIQSEGWTHYLLHTPEPNIFLFRRPHNPPAVQTPHLNDIDENLNSSPSQLANISKLKRKSMTLSIVVDVTFSPPPPPPGGVEEEEIENVKKIKKKVGCSAKFLPFVNDCENEEKENDDDDNNKSQIFKKKKKVSTTSSSAKLLLKIEENQNNDIHFIQKKKKSITTTENEEEETQSIDDDNEEEDITKKKNKKSDNPKIVPVDSGVNIIPDRPSKRNGSSSHCVGMEKAALKDVEALKRKSIESRVSPAGLNLHNVDEEDDILNGRYNLRGKKK